MTRIVQSAGLPYRRLAAWLAVGVALAPGTQAKAEPLVSRLSPGGGAAFAVAADSPTAARHTRTRPPRGDKMRELREAFLRDHGVEAVTLFFGYFGAFLPPPAAPTTPPTVPTDPLPPIVLGSGSTPPLQMPPSPPPLQMPASLPGFMPPPPTTTPSQTPEPATLLSGLVGRGTGRDRGLAESAGGRSRNRRREAVSQRGARAKVQWIANLSGGDRHQRWRASPPAGFPRRAALPESPLSTTLISRAQGCVRRFWKSAGRRARHRRTPRTGDAREGAEGETGETGETVKRSSLYPYYTRPQEARCPSGIQNRHPDLCRARELLGFSLLRALRRRMLKPDCPTSRSA